jgi:hypothetical protein
LGVSSSPHTLGVYNFIGTRVSSRVDSSSLLRKKPSSTPASINASTCIIHILALGELAKKKEERN